MEVTLRNGTRSIVLAPANFQIESEDRMKLREGIAWFDVSKLGTARFYFAKLFPETATLMRTARSGSKVLMDTDAALA